MSEEIVGPQHSVAVSILRWLAVVPCYPVILVTAFYAIWILTGVVAPSLADDGASWVSIVMVCFASFTAICISMLMAPKFKLAIAISLALLTVYFVPHPYSFESSPDGEAVPSIYELLGIAMGTALAIALLPLAPKGREKLAQSLSSKK